MNSGKRLDNTMLKKPGGSLICQHNPDGATVHYCTSPDCSYSPKGVTVERAVSLGVIEPVEDGLFTGCSQTFSLSRNDTRV